MSTDFDVSLLIKCMGMTSSDNDNQILVAIRKANDILARNGVTWDDVLRSKIKITTIADPFSSINIPKSKARPAERAPAPPAPAPRSSPPPRPPKPSNYGSGSYWSPIYGRWIDVPDPTPQPQRSQPNRFPGTCTLCGNIVGVGDGFAIQNAGSTRWHTEHKLGACPPRKPRKRQPLTGDDLMV
jgi:hypothetical protein